MIRTQYLSSLQHDLELQLKDVSTEMLNACLKMVEYVSVVPSKKRHLTFLDLYKRVDSSTSEEIFYNAVFYLTKKNINVLTQKYEAYNSLFDRYEAVVEMDDVDEILCSIRSGEYIHPLSGKVLSPEEFNKQVLTYFTPSNFFMSKLNAC